MTTTARHQAVRNDAAGRKVFLAEDSPLVVMSLEGLFDDMDWMIDGPATQLADALALAETTDADIALLDVNLDGEMSFEVADRLIARGVPVVFVTGYEGAGLLPERLKSVPVVTKPFAVIELEALLKGLVGDA
jgi:DNA-binding response OmpR family regulator